MKKIKDKQFSDRWLARDHKAMQDILDKKENGIPWWSIKGARGNLLNTSFRTKEYDVVYELIKDEQDYKVRWFNDKQTEGVLNALASLQDTKQKDFEFWIKRGFQWDVKNGVQYGLCEGLVLNSAHITPEAFAWMQEFACEDMWKEREGTLIRHELIKKATGPLFNMLFNEQKLHSPETLHPNSITEIMKRDALLGVTLAEKHGFLEREDIAAQIERQKYFDVLISHQNMPLIEKMANKFGWPEGDPKTLVLRKIILNLPSKKTHSFANWVKNSPLKDTFTEKDKEDWMESLCALGRIPVLLRLLEDFDLKPTERITQMLKEKMTFNEEVDILWWNRYIAATPRENVRVLLKLFSPNEAEWAAAIPLIIKKPPIEEGGFSWVDILKDFGVRLDLNQTFAKGKTLKEILTPKGHENFLEIKRMSEWMSYTESEVLSKQFRNSDAKAKRPAL